MAKINIPAYTWTRLSSPSIELALAITVPSGLDLQFVQYGVQPSLKSIYDIVRINGNKSPYWLATLADSVNPLWVLSSISCSLFVGATTTINPIGVLTIVPK